jgi:hypothetical protein
MALVGGMDFVQSIITHAGAGAVGSHEHASGVDDRELWAEILTASRLGMNQGPTENQKCLAGHRGQWRSRRCASAASSRGRRASR